MPIGRYFLTIGSALLALLLLFDWYFPPLEAEQGSSAKVDRTTIRLHSAHKGPKAVVFDTTQPTIVPAPVKNVAAPAPPPPAQEAYAMAAEPAAAAKPAEPVKASKRHVRRTRTVRPPASEAYAYRNDRIAPARREAFASRGFWPSW